MPKDFTPEMLDEWKSKYSTQATNVSDMWNALGAKYGVDPKMLIGRSLPGTTAPPAPDGTPDWKTRLADKWRTSVEEYEGYGKDIADWLVEQSEGKIGWDWAGWGDKKDEDWDNLDGTSYLPGKTKVLASPKYTVAEAGDTWETLAERIGFDFDPTMLAAMNPDMSKPTAGGAVNLSAKEQTWKETGAVPDYNFLLDFDYGTTADPSPTAAGRDLVYPPGWHPPDFRKFVGQTDREWMEDYFSHDVNFTLPKEVTESNLMNMLDPEAQSWLRNERVIQMGGIPSTHRWEKTGQGQWTEKPLEAVFDALYEANGINPEISDDVELFWSVADENLLFMADFFDVLDYPTGGYGGYGSPSYPSGGYAGRGQRPQRGDRSTILQLSSWSI